MHVLFISRTLAVALNNETPYQESDKLSSFATIVNMSGIRPTDQVKKKT